MNNEGLKNKGFTLIELLAILVILGVITLVSVPNVIRSRQISEERDLEEFRKTVENAAEVYLETHPDKIITVDGGTQMTISEFKSASGKSTEITMDDIVTVGLLNSNMTNPNTNLTIFESGGTISVSNNGGTLTYTYNP